MTYQYFVVACYSVKQWNRRIPRGMGCWPEYWYKHIFWPRHVVLVLVQMDTYVLPVHVSMHWHRPRWISRWTSGLRIRAVSQRKFSFVTGFSKFPCVLSPRSVTCWQRSMRYSRFYELRFHESAVAVSWLIRLFSRVLAVIQRWIANERKRVNRMRDLPRSAVTRFQIWPESNRKTKSVRFKRN